MACNGTLLYTCTLIAFNPRPTSDNQEWAYAVRDFEEDEDETYRVSLCIRD